MLLGCYPGGRLEPHIIREIVTQEHSPSDGLNRPLTLVLVRYLS